MQQDPTNPLMSPFLATADEAARARPSVDPDMIHEIFVEAATMLHNGLAIDGLDEHDVDAVIRGLCVALVADDPGAAIRTCWLTAKAEPGELHDPEAVSASYLSVAQILRV